MSCGGYFNITMYKTYNIDRTDLIKHNLEIVIRKLDLDQVVKDLIKGGEFILTAQDILDSLDIVPGAMIGVRHDVKPGECKIIYKS